MKHLRYLLLLWICWAEICQGQNVTFDPNFDIYILMGQSNMAGRGKVTDAYKSVSNPRVLMLTKANEWVTARHPVHFDKTVAGVGPGLSFGIEMAEASQGKRIGLIPCAVGGTSINKWVPGAFDSATNTHPWDDAEKRIREGMKYGVIKGVIWHQGEGDSNPDSARVYLDKLEKLIARVRKEVGKKRLPFVAGELGRYKANYAFINEVIVHLPQKVSRTAVVSSDGLVHNGDGTHFDSPSADEFGKRYAKAMLQLVK
ncbi:hypothetical protein DYBT9275_02337 [Dyadobacter sp. CECT 9275]|uniref:Sialate O-acetylesterase domain-containing protein n=1 Tax=Dyadobacter helix TaxID=2822344 RepID=A0A916JAM6_9BACT|nr:sialate O-acetylesterase [Dyadobacter sp. CECT 9275]CAG4999892.1 hypothetical protein DYBT9275_02337 [Dyadobacter sp. CECT 9275]